MKFKFYSFFGEIASVENLSSLEFGEHFQFERPDSRVINTIKNHIELFGQKNISLAKNPYEWNETYEPNNDKNNSYKIISTRLDKDKWKYLIITHNFKQDNRVIPLMLGLSKSDLTVLMQGNIDPSALTAEGYSRLYSGLSACIFYNDLPALNNINRTLHDQDIEEYIKIKLLLEDFEIRKDAFPEIDKALTDFLQLKYISIFSPFKILSFITVLELLLSNYDPSEENNVRISDQIKKKVNQLNKISSDPIHIKSYFKGPDTLNIYNVMGKIYKYRNNIAHGQFSDFEDQLQILKGKRNEIILFLNDVLKMVLMESLKNPEKIIDLKNK